MRDRSPWTHQLGWPIALRVRARLENGLSEAFFEHRLTSGSAIILLDGLDEAPSKQQRVQMVKLFENAAHAYKNCRFVLTSRPAAFRDEVAMPDCVQVQIDELEDDAIQTFLTRWCEALFTTSPQEAEIHFRELTERCVPSRKSLDGP